MRKLGVEFGGTNGLLMQQIATGTKHTGPDLLKLQELYISELQLELCKVMARFEGNETYLVEHKNLASMIKYP